MKNYWGPQKVSNPDFEVDLRRFFFTESDASTLKTIISSYETELSVISDRYEFIQQLLQLRKIFRKRLKYKRIKTEQQTIEGQKVLVVTRDEEIRLCRADFNGIIFDIDALCQYLLLTIIDTIMGQVEHENFTTWLRNNAELESYSLTELVELQEKYDEENGLRRNFIRAFTEHLSNNLKNRINRTFLISKIGLGSLNPSDLNDWEKLTDDLKYVRIVKYLYDGIRCRYTHSCSRTLLSNSTILGLLPTKNKVLVSQIDPDSDDLVRILLEVVKELVNEKYVLGRI